ncbi:dihydrolipoyl dehydrogenase family protein [Vallicoccus soli]|uniref:dihydrolipoyl dehydrogenase family protein n=1 Tax=Vallicoccus soli TaxID=2339232 RepID=UPI001402FC1A|nr:FAD-dependent oxidoreductase [Vallicoccus soli]
MESYDVVVLGAGTGGLGAARAVAAAGRTVALVEPERPGGDCTWTGCVPSKTLLETARAARRARRAGPRGVEADVRADLPAALAHARRVREEVYEDESPEVLARQGVDLVTGRGRFTGPGQVEVGGRVLRGRRYVVATGARPRVPDVVGGVPHLTSETVWDLAEAPGHLLVLGGGPVGCELAQAFAALGVRVTLVQSGPRLLPRDEPAAGEVVAAVLRDDGVDLRLGARVVGVDPGPVLHLDDGARVAGTHLLVCTGRSPETAGLGLDAAGVAVGPDGRVLVDDRLRSRTNPHVWAVGDCASPLAYTHVADDQARAAAGGLLLSLTRRPSRAALPGRWRQDRVPWVTFTDPEVAHVGLTEAQAHARWGAQARVVTVPMSAVDRARCAGRTEGFLTLVAAPGPLGVAAAARVVGMTAVCPGAGELVAAGALAVAARTTVARLALTTAAYPTYGVALRVAAAAFVAPHGGVVARPAAP